MIRRSAFTILFRLLLIAGVCFTLGWGIRNHEAPAPPAGPASPGDGAISVFFSNPPAFTGEFTDGPDADLVASIDTAQSSIDIAVYDLDLLSVARALLRARERGVAVRVVTNSDNWTSEANDLLRSVGIPYVGDQRGALMHDKFVVIDGETVWAGSMNLTENDAYRNDNNFLRIRSIPLAAVFAREFEEMFVQKRFGPSSPKDVPAPAMDVDGVDLEAYFAPEDHPAQFLIKALGGATRSIDFLAFSFTADDISAELQQKAGEGVKVRGVCETTQAHSNTGAECPVLQHAGLDVRLDGNPRNMHDKVMIIDESIVVTGSYNFTASAETQNDEDMLILRSPWIAARMETEFGRIYDMAVPEGVPAGGLSARSGLVELGIFRGL